MIYYNVEKIKEELKPIQVIEHLGVPYQRHGKNIFIFCPEHEERTGSVDRHIGNCVLNDTFQRAYYCFGCGASGNAFQLIAMLEHLDSKKDFPKILKIAYDACGGGSYFLKAPHEMRLTKTKQQREEEPDQVQTYLTKEQLSQIGLRSDLFLSKFSEVFDETQTEEEVFLHKDLNYSQEDSYGNPKVSCLIKKTTGYTLKKLSIESPEAYEFLIKNKAREQMRKYKKLARANWNQKYQLDSAFSSELSQYYKNKYLEAKSVFVNFASEKELKEFQNESWLFGYDALLNML